ncbi:SurA N-terminal domain-containing protein [Francisellaceae bacterium]|nr:SurA N-terminal domain-containing protein [Francisellaceae bacterium]
MLTVMRDKLSGWITWTIIVSISLVFVLFGISNYFESGPQASRTVATVGDLNITQSEVSNVMNNLTSQYPDMDNAALKEKATQALIDAKLKVASAEQMGVDLSTAQVDQTIYQIPAFQENGKFSENLFQYFISRRGLTLPAIRNDIKDNALSNQVAYGIAGSAFVLPDEMDAYTDTMLQERNIKQLDFLSKDFSDKAVVTNEEINAYYKSHQNEFKLPAEISINYIKLSVDQLAKNIEPSEEQALSYYAANKSAFFKPETRKYSQITLLRSDQKGSDLSQTAEDIIKKANSGEDFRKLVDKYSDDVLAKKDNGNMGWVEESSNDVDQEIIYKKLFSLKNVGDVSDPIKTEQGYEIIKLTGIKEASQQTFSDVKAEVINRIKTQKAEREFSSLGNEMSNLAFENPQSLDFVAKKLNLKVETTPFFSKEGGKAGIANDPQVINSAFSNNVLKDNNNSDPINISNTESIIIHLNDYKPSTVKPLALVKEKIKNDLKLQKQEELAKEHAQNIADTFNKGENTGKYNFKEINGISRDNKSFSPELIQKYMSAKVSSDTSHDYQVVALKDGYGVFAVTNIKLPENNNKMQNLMYGQLLQQTYGSYIYQLYSAEIKKEISVDIKN